MGKRKMLKLFSKFRTDLIALEELLANEDATSNMRNLDFTEKAAVLRNLEAEDRTYLAFVRTWMTAIAVVLALSLAYFKF